MTVDPAVRSGGDAYTSHRRTSTRPFAPHKIHLVHPQLEDIVTEFNSASARIRSAPQSCSRPMEPAAGARALVTG